MCPVYLLALPDLIQKDKAVKTGRKTGRPNSDSDCFECVMSMGWYAVEKLWNSL